nr:hypothetical protein GCM10020092_086230 [Actinoplanes digitatis]
MIRAVAASAAAAALLLTADPAAAAIGSRVAAGTGNPGAVISAARAKIGLTAGTGSPGAVISAARPKTELTLSYMAFNGYAAAVVLRCHPASGTHPKKVKGLLSCSRRSTATRACSSPPRRRARWSTRRSPRRSRADGGAARSTGRGGSATAAR